MDENKQYQEGWDSFFKLLDKDENPYDSKDEVSAFDWVKGWMDAASASDKWDYKF